MRKEQSVFLKKIKRLLARIGSWIWRNIFLLLVIFIFIFGICFLQEVVAENSTENYFACIISGVLGSVFSAGVVWITIKDENNVSKSDAHIKLRKLFFEESRMNIHELLLLYQNLCNIENQEEIYLLKKNKVLERLELKGDEITIKDNVLKNAEDLKKLKEKIELELRKDIANLYDYLGIFEIAKKMIDDRVLDKKLFKESYKYRLDAIENAFDNISFLQKQIERDCWNSLCDLIDMFK